MTSITLVRTGKTVKFLDLMIGSPFYYGGRFWTRTSYSAASEIKGSQWKDSRCGNFIIDEMKDEVLEGVEVKIE